MKKEIPWSSIIGFLLLLALGIGIPFWLEYQSLTNPAPASVSRKSRGSEAIDAKRGFYCPNCGRNIELPEMGAAKERGSELLSPLSLNELDRPRWETRKSSTQAAPLSRTALHENP
jgi:hypothetical protein